MRTVDRCCMLAFAVRQAGVFGSALCADGGFFGRPGTLGRPGALALSRVCCLILLVSVHLCLRVCDFACVGACGRAFAHYDKLPFPLRP